jgi:class 3 adenylate cyclase
VNTAARIGSVGHGGQILLSAATRDALGARLPAGIRLRELGSHQLHGLPAPEVLIQVEAEDLPCDFPDLRI